MQGKLKLVLPRCESKARFSGLYATWLTDYFRMTVESEGQLIFFPVFSKLVAFNNMVKVKKNCHDF